MGNRPLLSLSDDHIAHTGEKEWQEGLEKCAEMGHVPLFLPH